ncbi:MAG: C39 family peptidase [Ruminococcus sp.]|nr:C39 family peptidase [Ruminococcus sp.]
MNKRNVFMAFSLSIILLSGCENLKLNEPSASVDSTEYTSVIEDDNSSAIEVDVNIPIEETEPATTVTGKMPLVTVNFLPDSYQLDVEPLMQEPELPTGCEITSLTCLLNYLGFPADKVVMADTYLDYVLENGTDYTLFEKYIGNPHADGYGCYSPVIVKAASKYLADQNSNLEAIDLSGSTKEELFRVIASGHPIVIWNSVYNQYHEEYLAWSTPSGVDVYWNTYEHCMLLSGYNLIEENVTVCDPLRGEVQYDLEQFFDVYDDLYQQAMTIY